MHFHGVRDGAAVDGNGLTRTEMQIALLHMTLLMLRSCH